MSKNNLIIFEFIGFRHIPFLLLYIYKNINIQYYNANSRLKSLFILKKYFENGTLNQVSPAMANGFDSYCSVEKRVIADLDEIYQILSEGNKGIISCMENLIEDERVNLAYRKYASLKLSHDYINKSYAKSKMDEYDVVYVPVLRQRNSKIENFSDIRIFGETMPSVPFWSKFFNAISGFCGRAKFIVLFAALPAWVILFSLALPSKKPEKRKFQLGMRVYNNDWRFYHKYRSVDFLLDGSSLTRDNTVFCLERDVSSDYIETIREKNYNFMELGRVLHDVDFHFIKCIIGSILGSWLYVGVSMLLKSELVVKSTLEIMHTYILWNAFLSKYEIRNYVAYNDFMPPAIIRNIILSKKGIISWYYEHSCHSMDVFTPLNQDIYMASEFAYIYFDKFVSWNEQSTRFYGTMPNRFESFEPIGCLWSEHVRILLENPSENKLLKSARDYLTDKNNRILKKIIAIFDTSFGEAPLSVLDMKEFLSGIYNLLEKNSKIGMIFKMKHGEYIFIKYPDIFTYYERLMNHPRCYFVCAHTEEDTSEVVASSDLVISACFTAPTIEALGAGQKAIYYDATGRFGNTYYTQFPVLVAHDYASLIQLVDYWLYEVTEDGFIDYLNNVVQGELAYTIDGRAITDFRHRLCQ